MKNTYLKTLIMVVVMSAVLHSCRGKDDTTTPAPPTGNNNNALKLNSWEVTNDGQTTTYSRTDSAKGGITSPFNTQILYLFYCTPTGDQMSFTFKGNVPPATGVYKLVGGVVENADEVVIGATLGAGAFYSTTALNSKVNVTNTGGIILIEASNIAVTYVLSAKACTLSVKVQQ